MKLVLDGNSLNLEDLYVFAHKERGTKVSLAASAQKKILRSYKYVQSLAKGDEAIYGVNTGFGLLSDVKISKDKLAQLQVNLIRSHAVGVGNPLSLPEARAAMLLRANTLARGNSGCSLRLVKHILQVLNAGIVPWIPEQGSVGACGDLAPLAHMALVLIGEGKAYYRGRLLEGGKALKLAGLKPHSLEAKEGLALINGTQIMSAIGALVLKEAIDLAKVADIAGAISLEAVRGTSVAFDTKIHAVRPHATQIAVAKNLKKLLQKSEIAESHKGCGKVQDPYSFRCMPQVHGASRLLLEQAVPTINIELNASTDNPLVFASEKEILSGGNFHGEFVAMVMDTVAIALSELANISDLRIQKLINPHMSGLPAFLSADPGLNSGMMIVQVAAASLVSENKILSHPASVDSIPTSADKEDHVSMGVTAARKARQVLANLRNVLAMEIFCACQGLEFLQPLKAGLGAQAAYKKVRTVVKPAPVDRSFYLDIEKIHRLLREGDLLAHVQKQCGSLY